MFHALEVFAHECCVVLHECCCCAGVAFDAVDDAGYIACLGV